MPQNEIDPSLITNEPRKRKLASYVTNKDNISANKCEMVKRMKRTVDPHWIPQASSRATRPSE